LFLHIVICYQIGFSFGGNLFQELSGSHKSPIHVKLLNDSLARNS
jgi:hypothetical protein